MPDRRGRPADRRRSPRAGRRVRAARRGASARARPRSGGPRGSAPRGRRTGRAGPGPSDGSMSYRSVREALEASVRCSPVSLKRATSRSCRTSRGRRGRARAGPGRAPAARGSSWPRSRGRAGSPVRARTSGSCPSARNRSPRAAVRRSCQTSARCRGSPVARVPHADGLALVRDRDSRELAPADAASASASKARPGHRRGSRRNRARPSPAAGKSCSYSRNAGRRLGRHVEQEAGACRSCPGRSRESSRREPTFPCPLFPPPPSEIDPDEVGELARAMGKARGRATGGAVGQLEIDLEGDARRGTASIVMPISMQTCGEREHIAGDPGAQRALTGDRGARQHPQRHRIAQRAQASASPNPPPTRVANAATARSGLPGCSASTSGRARCGLAQVAVAEARAIASLCAPARVSAARTPAVIAWPLPITRSLRTTVAPAVACELGRWRPWSRRRRPIPAHREGDRKRGERRRRCDRPRPGPRRRERCPGSWIGRGREAIVRRGSRQSSLGATARL